MRLRPTIRMVSIDFRPTARLAPFSSVDFSTQRECLHFRSCDFPLANACSFISCNFKHPEAGRPDTPPPAHASRNP